MERVFSFLLWPVKTRTDRANEANKMFRGPYGYLWTGNDQSQHAKSASHIIIETSIYKLGDVGISSNLIGSLSLTNEQLFTEVEVNRPGYSPSRECGEMNILGFSPTLR